MSILQDEDMSSTITYDKRIEELMFATETETLPLRYTSAGYRSLIGMVADIAYRMAVLNPDLKYDIISKTNGVVLIDEIDLHIHPKWQWNITKALTETFPSVQFIATTHSPIVIASCKAKNLINLYDSNSDKKIIQIDQEVKKTAYGWMINDVLIDYMETSERCPEVKTKLNQIKDLSIKSVKKTITNEESVIFDRLKNELYSELPENDAVIEEIELSSIGDILKERGKENA